MIDAHSHQGPFQLPLFARLTEEEFCSKPQCYYEAPLVSHSCTPEFFSTIQSKCFQCLLVATQNKTRFSKLNRVDIKDKNY